MNHKVIARPKILPSGAKPSTLWERINNTCITKERIANLENFKSDLINFKIALWDPRVNGVRYLKALIYVLCSFLSKSEWAKVSKVKNRDIGKPYSVRYKGHDVCLDYLQALFELNFIEKGMPLKGARILEIGAGYGRTCHAIMSNHAIAAYAILDLENCLELSRRYLKRVLARSKFAKINFIKAENTALLDKTNFDLCINIDSFAEMDADVVKYYLSFINKHCNCLYIKNPVGKYLDKSLDGHYDGEKPVQLALATGLLRDIIEIHDQKAVEAKAGKFVRTYRPGRAWNAVADSWAIPWSYYWQALYKRKPKVLT